MCYIYYVKERTMDLKQAATERHSVRHYIDMAIPNDVIVKLQNVVDACNAESGLNIQLICNEPKAFGSFMAHYGSFEGVRNYIAMVGKKSDKLQERAGYYGEKVVLSAQALGLNTCWVAVTYSKGKCRANVGKDEKLVCVIALGYGKSQGVPHKSKPMEKLCDYGADAPEWFKEGVKCAMLAPTAVNQQQFRLSYSEGNVIAESLGGFYTKLDLGIVKFHFELGAGKDNFQWKDK